MCWFLHDLGKIDESIEILWIELRGRNKITPLLTGVVYQPSSNETEKLVRLGKFEHILREVFYKMEWCCNLSWGLKY